MPAGGDSTRTPTTKEGDDGATEETLELLKFLPSVLVQQCSNNLQSESWRDSKQPVSAVFVYVDVYGIHAVTNSLSKQGQGGEKAEKGSI